MSRIGPTLEMCRAVRFVPQDAIEDLLHCWRMTAVGHTIPPGSLPASVDPFSRYGRMLRAVALFEQMRPGIHGAYKDLDALLGIEPGRITA